MKWVTLCMVLGLAVMPVLAVRAEVPVELTLEINKSAYLLGEPILCKTVFRTTRLLTGMESWVGAGALGSRFSFLIASATGDYFHIDLRESSPIPFDITYPPGISDFFRDWQVVPSPSRVGERQERIDLNVVFTAGKYRLKAVIYEKDPDFLGKDVVARESNEVAFTILPGSASDSITQVMDETVLPQLGRLIYFCHYMHPSMLDLRGTRFQDLVPRIIAECGDSVFHEWVWYAYVMRNRDGSVGYWPINNPHALSLAEQFAQEYPDSWLVPDIGSAVFWTHRYHGRVQEAVALGEELLSRYPERAVLKGIRTQLEKLHSASKE